MLNPDALTAVLEVTTDWPDCDGVVVMLYATG